MSGKLITTAADKAKHLLEEFSVFDEDRNPLKWTTFNFTIKCVDEMLGCVSPHNADEIKYLNNVKKELLKIYKTW